MKQNKWKSNEANDKSLTGAKSAVLREKRKTQTLLLLSQSGRWLCAVVNIYWLIMSPSYHCIFMASDVDIKKYYTTTPHSSPALLTVRSSSLYDLRQINKIILLSGGKTVARWRVVRMVWGEIVVKSVRRCKSVRAGRQISLQNYWFFSYKQALTTNGFLQTLLPPSQWNPRAVSLLFLTELSWLCVSERVKKTNVIECKKSDPIPRLESWNTHGFQLEKFVVKKIFL